MIPWRESPQCRAMNFLPPTATLVLQIESVLNYSISNPETVERAENISSLKETRSCRLNMRKNEAIFESSVFTGRIHAWNRNKSAGSRNSSIPSRDFCVWGSASRRIVIGVTAFWDVYAVQFTRRCMSRCRFMGFQRWMWQTTCPMQRRQQSCRVKRKTRTEAVRGDRQADSEWTSSRFSLGQMVLETFINYRWLRMVEKHLFSESCWKLESDYWERLKYTFIDNRLLKP